MNETHHFCPLWVKMGGVMSLKNRSVKVSFSEEGSPEAGIWLFRIMERIVLDQLNIDPVLKGKMLYSNQEQITKFINEFDKGGE
ncbi:hypothetical protein ABER02_11265 [Rossellomorea marisflavi]|uniref:hypothetical protein n=1 Tax=Rossellomorea marisflavi TaxID=189381 RepID=UPI003D2A693E